MRWVVARRTTRHAAGQIKVVADRAGHCKRPARPERFSQLELAPCAPKAAATQQHSNCYTCGPVVVPLALTSTRPASMASFFDPLAWRSVNCSS